MSPRALWRTYHTVGIMVFYYYYQTGEQLSVTGLWQQQWLMQRAILCGIVPGIGGMAKTIVTTYQIPSLIMS